MQFRQSDDRPEGLAAPDLKDFRGKICCVVPFNSAHVLRASRIHFDLRAGHRVHRKYPSPLASEAHMPGVLILEVATNPR